MGLLNSRISGLRLLLLQCLGGTGKQGQMEGIIMEYKKMGGKDRCAHYSNYDDSFTGMCVYI